MTASSRPDAWLRRLGSIPGRMLPVRVPSPEIAQLARVHAVLASWQAGIDPGCGCDKCAVLAAAVAEMTDAMEDDADPLYVGVGCAGNGRGSRQ